MSANHRVTEVGDGPRIAQFQLNMAHETEELELDRQLVHEAVEYLIQHPQYGYYFANKISEQSALGKAGDITGSLLCTFQNTSSWWIQSVYVDKQFRKQGIFTSLFQDLIKLAKEQSVKRVSLYAESNNQRALETYKRLGMHVTDERLYGYDLVYSLKGYELLKHSLQTMPKEFVFQLGNKEMGAIEALGPSVNILQTAPSINKQILGYDSDKQPCLYAQYFQQFSDWRFGRMLYISCLLVKEGAKLSQLLPQFIEWLVSSAQGLRIQAIRLIQSGQIKSQLTVNLPGLEQLHYLMVRIDL